MPFSDCDDCGGPVHSKSNACLKCGAVHANTKSPDQDVTESGWENYFDPVEKIANEHSGRRDDRALLAASADINSWAETNKLSYQNRTVPTESKRATECETEILEAVESQQGNQTVLQKSMMLACLYCDKESRHEIKEKEGAGILFILLLLPLIILFMILSAFSSKKNVQNDEYICIECGRKHGTPLSIDEEVQLKHRQLQKIASDVSRCYLVEPCRQCKGTRMFLYRFGPEGRAVQYGCLSCERSRKRWAEAASDEHLAVYTLALNLFGERCESELGQVSFDTVVPKLGYQIGSRETIPKDTRARVWRRDGGACRICSSSQKLHFDHIIPVSKGGSNFVDNIQVLCAACNLSKSNKI